jgi:hypothetical protein
MDVFRSEFRCRSLVSVEAAEVRLVGVEGGHGLGPGLEVSWLSPAVVRHVSQTHHGAVDDGGVQGFVGNNPGAEYLTQRPLDVRSH